MKVACVDLFCGAGGLSLGLRRAGVPVVLGVDADSRCRYPYEENLGVKFEHADIRRLDRTLLPIDFQRADVKVLAGCAPCQPFSTYTQGRLHPDDERWGLLASFANLVDDARPDVVTMENVWRLTKHAVFREFVDMLHYLQYEVDWWPADCRLYGVPQTRQRLVLLAVRQARPTPLSTTHNCPSEWMTVRDFIEELPPIAAGEQHHEDPIHVSSALSAANLARIRAAQPGGTWRDWPNYLVAECHRRETGSTYPSIYGRMNWDEPAPTITGQCYGFGNGRFGHPVQNRAISLREAALLQTFPREYAFVSAATKVRMKHIGQMIGNAVPPALGEAVGKAILASVSNPATAPKVDRIEAVKEPFVAES